MHWASYAGALLQSNVDQCMDVMAESDLKTADHLERGIVEIALHYHR